MWVWSWMIMGVINVIIVSCQLFSTRFVKFMIRDDYHAQRFIINRWYQKMVTYLFFYRKNVNNKLYKHNRGTIDLESFDSYKCVHIFIFISNFHSIITRMGLYHAINLSCAAYVKKYIISKNHFHFWIFSTSECHGSCWSMFPWQQPLTAWVHAGVL